MFSRQTFDGATVLYRTGDNFRVPVLPTVSHEAVGARMVMTPGPLGRLGMNVCITVVARLPHSLNGVFHPKEISAPITTISINNRIRNNGASQTS